MVEIPDRDVGPLAGLECASVVAEAESSSGVSSDACQAFFRRESEQTRAETHRELHRAQRRGTGIAIGRKRDRYFGIAQLFDRWFLRLIQSQVGTRQQYGNRAGLGHRPNARFRCVLEVIGGQCVEVCSEFRTTAIAQLVRMQFDREAERLCLAKQFCDLYCIESDRLAVRIDGIGKATIDDLGKQFVAYEINVGIRVVLELGRDGVRGE